MLVFFFLICATSDPQRLTPQSLGRKRRTKAHLKFASDSKGERLLKFASDSKGERLSGVPRMARLALGGALWKPWICIHIIWNFRQSHQEKDFYFEVFCELISEEEFKKRYCHFGSQFGFPWPVLQLCSSYLKLQCSTSVSGGPC